MPSARTLAHRGGETIERVATVGRVVLERVKGEKPFFFTSRLQVDADGSPKAYHPPTHRHRSGSPPGLDRLANAGSPGNWFGIVTNRSGEPVVQGHIDPAPGFYVSQTALVYRERPRRADPRRYVDATKIPYIVLSPQVRQSTGARLGDLAFVWNRRNGKAAHAIFADIGPANEIGEGSIVLARALGIPSDPKAGGQTGDVVSLVFPRSGNQNGRQKAEIVVEARAALRAWGGLRRLKKVAR
jgi:Fungal chitosanase of glycosyl hydrolase group 75